LSNARSVVKLMGSQR